MKKICLIIAILFAGTIHAFAQLEKPVSWSYLSTKKSKTEATVFLKATIQERWHIYALEMKSGPIQTSIKFAPSKDFTLVGNPVAPKPITIYNKALKSNLSYYEGEVVFVQKIKLNKPTTTLKVKVEFTACNDKSCLPSDEISFNIPVK